MKKILSVAIIVLAAFQISSVRAQGSKRFYAEGAYVGLATSGEIGEIIIPHVQCKVTLKSTAEDSMTFSLTHPNSSRPKEVSVKGSELYQKEVGGWYFDLPVSLGESFAHFMLNKNGENLVRFEIFYVRFFSGEWTGCVNLVRVNDSE